MPAPALSAAPSWSMADAAGPVADRPRHGPGGRAGRRFVRRLASVAVLAGLLGPAAVLAGSLQATVVYRERQLPPPGALLEVTLEDTARAGAPAATLARVRRPLEGGPPYAVRLEIDPAAIPPAARPSLRARITHEGRLLWTTTTVTPVAPDAVAGADRPLTLTMVRAAARPPSPAEAGASGAAGGPAPRAWVDVSVPVPPGRWSGLLPSASGGGHRWTLDLYATGATTDTAPTGLRYELRVQPADPPDARPVDDLGLVVPDGTRLRLVGTTGESRLLERDGDDLRLLDRQGQPVATALPMVLRREPASLRGPQRLRLPLRGELVVTADAPRIRLCADGRRLPVAFDGDFASAERAWRAAGRSAGEPLLIEFEGLVEPRPSAERGDRREAVTVVVRRFGAAWPRETCGQPAIDRALLGTPWRLVRLDGRAVAGAPGPRDAQLALQTSGEGVRVAGSTGCNRLTGRAELSGDGGLRFAGTATTRMACPGADGTESGFLQALSGTTRHRIAGSHLDLLDDTGRVLARLEADPPR